MRTKLMTPGLLPLWLLTGVLAACSDRAMLPVAPLAQSHYEPTASIQEIMDSIVDPAADAIWQSVGTTVDEHGINDRQPRTEAEWHALRRHAVTLVEAANLLAVPGRRAALTAKTVEDAAPLDAAPIQSRLDANHAALVGFADALRATARQLVAAADRRDAAAILDQGGTLDEVCESCHKVFWYPEPQAK